MIIVVDIIAIIKNKIYLIKLLPVKPVVNHIGRCHIPHQKPIMMEDFNGEYFSGAPLMQNPPP